MRKNSFLRRILIILTIGLLAGCIKQAHGQQLYTNITALPGGGEQITISTNPLAGLGSTNAPATGGSGDLFGDIGNIATDLGVPSSITNYGGGIGFSKSFSHPGQVGAFALVVANVTTNGVVGFVAGADKLWGGGKVGSANILSGGLTLKERIYPLRYLFRWAGISLGTNTWAYKEGATVYAADLLGKALGNTASTGNGVANIVRGGVNLDLWQFSNGLFISLAIDYGNRTGSGAYDGNWGDIMPNVHFRF